MTSNELPKGAPVVVIGGGVVGASVLYHLAVVGCPNAILIERASLTSGTTWHSAAGVAPVGSSRLGVEMSRYSMDLYQRLEEETGQATAWRQPGFLEVAASDERMTNLRHKVSTVRASGVSAQLVDPGEVADLWPMLRTDDVVGGLWVPEGGRVDPNDTTQALIAGARSRGAQVFLDTEVTGIEVKDGAVAAIQTSRGRVECQSIVNAAGLWGRQVGELISDPVPLYACEHEYIITEPMSGVSRDLPWLRIPDAHTYVREEVGGLLVGFFEPNAKALPLESLPADQAFLSLAEDWDHILPLVEMASHRIPAIGDAGIKKLFSGPESFTPDGLPLVGESAGVRGHYLACGMNSGGVTLAGGIGRELAELIVNGRSPNDLSAMDIKRFDQADDNTAALHERIPEILSTHHVIHWPTLEHKTLRGIRRSPFHETYRRERAHFSQRALWERPAWLAPNGENPEPVHSFGRPNWFEWSAAEHEAARNRVALFDMTPFVKLQVEGPDAESFLQRLCANDVAVSNGRVVYTGMLNQAGGYESDPTVTRLGAEKYLVVTGSRQRTRDACWLKRNLRENELVTLTDMTSAWAVVGVLGPRSRALLSELTSADLGNEAFRFATSQEIELGRCIVRAARTSYVGELGFELYMPTEIAMCVFEQIRNAGEKYGARLAGDHAMESLRLEKGFRAWGPDIGTHDTPLEAGLKFATKLDSGIDFIGRTALLAQRKTGVKQRLLTFVFEDPEAYSLRQEPIYRNGVHCGHTTSAAFGHTIGRGVALGWVQSGDVSTDAIGADTFEIEIADRRFAVTPHFRAPYDPSGARLRS